MNVNVRPVSDTGYPLWFWLRCARAASYSGRSPLDLVLSGDFLIGDRGPKWPRCNELLYRYVRRFPYAVRRDDGQALARIYGRGGSYRVHDASLFTGRLCHYGYFQAHDYDPQTGHWRPPAQLPGPPWTRQCDICEEHLPATAFVFEDGRFLSPSCRDCIAQYSEAAVRAAIARSLGIPRAKVPPQLVAAKRQHLLLQRALRQRRKEERGNTARREGRDEPAVSRGAQPQDRPENGERAGQHRG